MPVTIDELKDLWIKVQRLNKTKEEFKQYLIEKYKIKESSKELTRKQFDKVMKDLKKELDKAEMEEEQIDKDFTIAEQKGLI